MNHHYLSRLETYCRHRGLALSARVYLVDALGAMALGLFASLLMGTILQTLGERLGLEPLITVASYAKRATGAAIAMAIATSLGARGVLLFSAVAVGLAGMELGGPVGAYIATVVAIELGKLVYRQTKVDILVTPSVVLLIGVGMSVLVGPSIDALMTMLGGMIQRATHMQPFLMGMVISVVVGMLLTLPISSAAICIAIGLGGLAGGAATAGCCAQMIGFAVMSYRDNGWGGLVAQGLGTSMLQMPNIVRKPIVWLPPTLASAITGPVATCVFGLHNIPIASGMGTCGLVGPIGIYTAMPEGGGRMWLGLLLVCFVLPALLTWLIAWPLRRRGWLLAGDLTITH